MVYLVSNRLINCQSHRDTLLQFTEGINVIVAPNGTGKSVFFKMLIAATYPQTYTREELASLMRWGTDKAISMYEFSDGSEGGVGIYDRNNITHYYREDKSQPFMASHVPFPEIIERLSVLCDETTKFFANILDQDQALLFVKKSSSANNLVRMVVSHPKLDKLIDDLSKNIETFREEEKRLAQIMYYLEKVMLNTRYTDLALLESTHEMFEHLLVPYEVLVNGLEHLENIQDASSLEDYDTLIDLCEFYIKSEELLKDFKVVEDNSELADLFLPFLEASIELNGEFPTMPSSSDLDFYDIIDQFVDGSEHAATLLLVEDDVTTLDFVDTVIPLFDMRKEVLALQQTLVELELSTTELVAMEEEFLREGSVINGCPIYGSVAHVGEICIPLDNGLALDTQKL